MSKRKIFLDANLFGNDAGEDESIDKLKEYFLTTTEQELLFSKDNKLNFVRSRKGMGKSALLCYTGHMQGKHKLPVPLIVITKINAVS